MTIDWQAIAAPFPPEAIEWRIGQVAKSGKSATLLAYLTSRAVMDRLDAVVGPDGWCDEYVPGPGGGVMCRLSVRVGDEWLTKCDAAENTQIEGVKGGISDALKRAAVKFGIGRYLYSLPEVRQPVNEGWPKGNQRVVRASWKDGQKRMFGWCAVPSLPAWALPPQAIAAARKAETPEQTTQRRNGHDPEWEAGGRSRFMARLAEVGDGLSYDDVRAWAEAHGKGKPSTWPPERRKTMLDWLGDGHHVEVHEWLARGAA